VFGFTGEPSDANGLVYLRARYYNPTIGQFPSLDPIEVPNRYRYADANPVNRTDPSGLFTNPSTCLTDDGEIDLVCLATKDPVAYQDFVRSANSAGVLTEDLPEKAKVVAAGAGGASSAAAAAGVASVVIPVTIVTAAATFLIWLSLEDIRAGGGSLACPPGYTKQQCADMVEPTPSAQTTHTTPQTQTDLRQKEPKPKLCPPPTPQDYNRTVLVLGEANGFFYATPLAAMHTNWNVVGSKYGDGSNNQSVISQIGNLTLVDNVDATNLQGGSYTKDHRFNDIVFNAPRAGQGWKKEAGDLVDATLSSALNVLTSPGYMRFSSGGGMPAVPRLDQRVRPGQGPSGYSSAIKIPYLSDVDFGIPTYVPRQNNGDPMTSPTLSQISWYIFGV
jgi:RHS repeat-associated protein